MMIVSNQLKNNMLVVFCDDIIYEVSDKYSREWSLSVIFGEYHKYVTFDIEGIVSSLIQLRLRYIEQYADDVGASYIQAMIERIMDSAY